MRGINMESSINLSILEIIQSIRQNETDFQDWEDKISNDLLEEIKNCFDFKSKTPWE